MTETVTDATAGRVLEAAIILLRTELMPHLTDDSARVRADHLTRLLRWTAARLSKREQGMQQMVDDILASPPVPLPAAAADISLPVSARRDEIEAAISAAWPAILDGLEDKDGNSIPAIEAILRAEKKFYVGLDRDILDGSQVVYRFGRIESEPEPKPEVWPALDAANLTAYLRKRFARDDVFASDVKMIPGGFSKLTAFFTLNDAQAPAPQLLVIRKDMPFRFMDKTVVDEYPVLRRLFAASFPVAEPLWLEEDVSIFGAAFMVSARVEGNSNVAVWGADPARARRACAELARVLGKFHSFVPSELGYPAASDARSAGICLENDIKAWTARFHQVKRETLPLLELPLLWLARNIPAALYARPAKVMHGDLGFHNIMVGSGGNISAILDWEFSGLGDPSQDLRFLRMFIEPLMPWNEFLGIYLANGGIAPCPDTDFIYDLWIQVRNNIGGVESQDLFDSGTTDDVKFALSGHIFAPYLFIDQCESLLARLKSEGK